MNITKPILYRYHVEKGITVKGIILKVSTQRGITQRGKAQKGITQRCNTQRGITQRANMQKGITQKGSMQRGINTKRQHAKRHRKKGNLQKTAIFWGNLITIYFNFCCLTIIKLISTYITDITI